METEGSARFDGAPDFILLGVPWRDGCAVFASTELSRAELRYEADLEVYPFAPCADLYGTYRPVDTRYFITAEMRTYVVAYGPDYRSALMRLLSHWNPDQRPERRELTPDRRALEAGP